MNKIFVLILSFISLISTAYAKEYRCRLYDHQKVIFDKTVTFEDGEQVQMTLIRNEKVQIDTLAMVEFVSIRSFVNHFQTQALGHLGAGLILSNPADDLDLYALCDISL